MSGSLRFALFLLLSTAVVLGAHVYLYRRLVRDPIANLRWRKVGVVAMAGLALSFLLARFFRWVFPSAVPSLVWLVPWVWLGVATYVLLTLWVVGALSVAAAWTRRRLGGRGGAAAEQPASPERRRALAQLSATSALAVSAAVSGYGSWRAFYAPEVTELVIPLRGLPKALEGFTLVQVSDLHVGNLIRRKFMDEVVRRCNALKPDLVAVTGDLVDGPVSTLSHAVAALQNLKAPHGSYFVTGNHEYYAGAEEWCRALPGLGLQVLRNRRVTIGDAGASFDLLGVDDWSVRSYFGGGYDLEAATAGRDAQRPAVLLAHQPRGFDLALKKGVGLQLSGHTHGGQLFPFTEVVKLIWGPHAAGLLRAEGGALYVNRGTGFWGPPMRVGSPPEITKVVLLAS